MGYQSSTWRGAIEYRPLLAGGAIVWGQTPIRYIPMIHAIGKVK